MRNKFVHLPFNEMRGKLLSTIKEIEWQKQLLSHQHPQQNPYRGNGTQQQLVQMQIQQQQQAKVSKEKRKKTKEGSKEERKERRKICMELCLHVHCLISLVSFPSLLSPLPTGLFCFLRSEFYQEISCTNCLFERLCAKMD